MNSVCALDVYVQYRLLAAAGPVGVLYAGYV